MVARVPAGEAFSARQRDDIVRAINLARAEAGLEVSVYVGALEGAPRARAERLHAALPDAPNRVLIAVDPGARRLELVTGSALTTVVDDRAAGLAAVAMTSGFAAGDLAGGVINGIRTLSEHARRPRILHAE